jgi:rubredoxin
MPGTGKIRRTWELNCSGCDEGFICGSGDPTAAVHTLRAQGWETRKGLWVCPDCIADERKAKEEA